jgi:hypothetical protein
LLLLLHRGGGPHLRIGTKRQVVTLRPDAIGI